MNNDSINLNVNLQKQQTNVPQALTDATKKKLELYGVDTSKIKTEDEGQKELTRVEKEIEKEDNSKKNSEQKNSMNLTYTVKQLAKQIGTNVETYDSTEKILSKTYKKISELKDSDDKNLDRTKLKTYEENYQLILQKYLTTKRKQDELNDSMNSLAYYNKIFQNMR